MAGNNFIFKVDVNVINHLGVGLYSSTPSALTELVANSWDADAEVVDITVDKLSHKCTIEDDGHGMTAEEINNKFLKVGYSRRQNSISGNMSEGNGRRVMGRKGIGKLSMFALADKIRVSSQREGAPPVGFIIDVPNFRKNLEQNKVEELEEFEPESFKKGQGTKIELIDMPSNIDKTESFLRRRLARRFSVIEDSGFDLNLNGTPIKKEDRGFYSNIQFLWVFDEDTAKDIGGLCKNLQKIPVDSNEKDQKTCIASLKNTIYFGKDKQVEAFKVKGYIASVFQPSQLGSKEDSANMVSIFANGRVFAEDILSEANSAKLYQNYLVGEVHADFLDDDDVDRATASREAIKKDDPKYLALLNFIKEELKSIGDQWDSWRIELGLNKQDPINEVVLEWIDGLDDPRDKSAANKLMTSIQNSIIHSDDKKNDEAKKVLYKGGIIAFEKLRINKSLDKLSEISNVLSPEFAMIFSSLDQVEEAAYADITRQRLAIIEKFANISNDPRTLERVAHKYLFDHLWLLDPTWDRVTSKADMELTLTKYLKNKCKDSTGARLDISYKTSSGRHVVVELKKPTKTNLKYIDLLAQAMKYNEAVRAYYEQTEPNKPVPQLSIYLLVAKTPNGYDEGKRKTLETVNASFITYEQLINDAKSTYQDYLNARRVVGGLETLLSRI